MYGAGARLDHAPDLLFTLRGVDRAEMIGNAGADLPMTQAANASKRVLADDDVAALFGIEMEPPIQSRAVQKNKKAVHTPPATTTQIQPAKIPVRAKNQFPAITKVTKRSKRV